MRGLALIKPLINGVGLKKHFVQSGSGRSILPIEGVNLHPHNIEAVKPVREGYGSPGAGASCHVPKELLLYGTCVPPIIPIGDGQLLAASDWPERVEDPNNGTSLSIYLYLS